MSTYPNDFSQYETGSQPSDWTLRFGSRTWNVAERAGATGGKVLRVTGAADEDFLSWDAINGDAQRANAEVYFRVWLDTGSLHELRALMRGFSNSGRNGYIFGIRPQSDSYNMSYWEQDAFTDLFTPPSEDYSADVLWHVVSRVNGTTMRFKYWPDVDDEPEGWTEDRTDNTLSAAGWVGLYSNRADQLDIDFVGVGTNGDSAPRTTSGGGGGSTFSMMWRRRRG